MDAFTKVKVQSIYYVLVRHQTYLKGGTTNETSDTCYFRNWELQTVLLKRPGKRSGKLDARLFAALLFDDIPYLPIIQKEHDYFAQTLRNRGVEVLYLEKLAAEALVDKKLREEFVDRILKEGQADVNVAHQTLKEYLLSFSNEELIQKLWAVYGKTKLKQVRRHIYMN